MKKIIYVLVALLAFTCGVFLFYIYPSLIPVPLYELKGNEINKYSQRTIKVTGYFSASKAESTYFYELNDFKEDCLQIDLECSNRLSLELPKKVELKNILLIDDIANKNNQLGKTDFRSGIFGAKVEITAYVAEEPNQYFGGTIAFLKVENIKKLSATEFISLE